MIHSGAAMGLVSSSRQISEFQNWQFEMSELLPDLLSAGIESFSKLGDSIYLEEKGGKPALYIVQYIPSTFNWRSVGLTVTQQVKPLSSSDQNLQVSLSISAKVKQKTFSMMIRWKG